MNYISQFLRWQKWTYKSHVVWILNDFVIQPFKRQSHIMVKYTKTIRQQQLAICGVGT